MGAGFVGSSLALAFKRNRSTATVVVLDNLKRRGSELALERLRAGGVAHEIVVVNDNSTDGTGDVLAALAARYGTLRVIDNAPPNGFGFAVRAGLDACWLTDLMIQQI